MIRASPATPEGRLNLPGFITAGNILPGKTNINKKNLLFV